LANSYDYLLSNYFSRSVFSQASEAQSSESVLPVPVGDSSKAFYEFSRAAMTFFMKSV
jgi:hypothetical protein